MNGRFVVLEGARDVLELERGVFRLLVERLFAAVGVQATQIQVATVLKAMIRCAQQLFQLLKTEQLANVREPLGVVVAAYEQRLFLPVVVDERSLVAHGQQRAERARSARRVQAFDVVMFLVIVVVVVVCLNRWFLLRLLLHLGSLLGHRSGRTL